MDILDSILEKWNKNKDVELLITEGVFNDQVAIQSSLEKLSGLHKDKVLGQLNEIEIAVRDYIDSLDKDKKVVKAQMDATLKAAKACLSYGSSIDIQNRGKE